MKTIRCLPFALASVVLTACEEKPLTWEEAKLAVEEAALASQAESFTAGSIEITSDFTMGEAVEAAAEQIRTFVETQLPCAEVTVTAGHVDIDYGAKPGDCTYRGHTYEGRQSVTVSRNDDDVVVEHEWTDFTNGILSVTGTATVTYDLDDPSRHVQHRLAWTRLADGRSGVGNGDRTQRPLGGDLLTGIVVDGTRSWEGTRGGWYLSINSVEARWVDPVPQAGSYTLDTPFKKSVTMEFDRLDDNTIRVTVRGSGGRSFHFDVSRLGEVS